MKRIKRHKSRTLITEFSSKLGSETLNVRIYRHRESFVCERELVERDGTSFTMVVPFTELETARALLTADPYYGDVRQQVGRALIKLDYAVRSNHG
jgi:hypothetical protein